MRPETPWDLPDRLAAVTAPALVVGGGADALLGTWPLEVAVRLFSAGRLERGEAEPVPS